LFGYVSIYMNDDILNKFKENIEKSFNVVEFEFVTVVAELIIVPDDINSVVSEKY
jgi:hypothetical protein